LLGGGHLTNLDPSAFMLFIDNKQTSNKIKNFM
jgi:hypothetical protein